MRGRCASVSSLQCSHASTAAGEPGSAHRHGHASATARQQLAVPGSRPPHAGRCARGRSSLGGVLRVGRKGSQAQPLQACAVHQSLPAARVCASGEPAAGQGSRACAVHLSPLLCSRNPARRSSPAVACFLAACAARCAAWPRPRLTSLGRAPRCSRLACCSARCSPARAALNCAVLPGWLGLSPSTVTGRGGPQACSAWLGARGTRRGRHAAALPLLSRPRRSNPAFRSGEAHGGSCRVCRSAMPSSGLTTRGTAVQTSGAASSHLAAGHSQPPPWPRLMKGPAGGHGLPPLLRGCLGTPIYKWPGPSSPAVAGKYLQPANQLPQHAASDRDSTSDGFAVTCI